MWFFDWVKNIMIFMAGQSNEGFSCPFYESVCLMLLFYMQLVDPIIFISQTGTFIFIFYKSIRSHQLKSSLLTPHF